MPGLDLSLRQLERFSSGSTPAGFARLRFKAIRRAGCNCRSEAGISKRTFTRPQRLSRYRVTSEGSKAPALLLRSPNIVSMSSVHPDFPPRPVSRTSGEITNQNPLLTSSTSVSMALPVRRSPSGLAPFQLKAPDPDCHLRNLPLAMPDLPSLPTGRIV